MEDPGEEYYQAPRAEVAAFVPAGITSLLDVGCGAGAFLEGLRSTRPELALHGLEPNPDAASAARAKGLDVISGGYPGSIELLGTYDCVVFNDVLEHLVDPWAALADTHAILAPGARVVASIPNVRNVATLREVAIHGEFRYREAGVLDRTHLRFFTRSSMREMFEDAGFEVEQQAGINATRSRRERWLARGLGVAISGLRTEGPYRQFVTVAHRR